MKKYQKSLGLLMALLLLSSPVAYSDEFEDFARSEMESFASYRDERDAEFVSFLKSQWEEFQAFQGLVRDKNPKPRIFPVAKPPEPPKPEELIAEGDRKPEPIPAKVAPTIVEKIVVPELPPSLPPEPVPVVLPEAPETPDPSDLPPAEPVVVETPPEPFVGVAFLYFGSQQNFEGSFGFPELTLTTPPKPFIAGYWDKMSRSKYEDFLSQAGAVRQALELNDWGYHAMLFQAGLKVHDGDRDLANLFAWFMSVKSGYDARCGYSDQRIFLLLPSRNRLYGVSYLTIKGTRYYAMTFDGTKEKLERLFTYKASYPRSNRLMDYRIIKTPKLDADIENKALTFEFAGEPQTFNVSYNKALVDYFRNYPQTNIKIYFDADTSSELDYTMVREFKESLEGKSEVEAVNYLLGFVQKAFKYKTDDEQLGHEKYMLPEETLAYPYSDCEDRSFLFAYLVRTILKLDVVGLNYPGHVATAVRFSDNLSGDYVVMNNRKYIVCDPTYINASAGMAMPRYKRRNPDVVKIRNWR